MKRTSINGTKKKFPNWHEWYFAQVPKDELLACLIHEYSRERIHFQPELKAKIHSANYQESIDLVATALGTPYPHLLGEPWQNLHDSEKARSVRRIQQHIGDLPDVPATFGNAFSWSDVSLFTREDFISIIADATAFHGGLSKIEGTEFGLFSIDWRFPKKVLVENFAEWLSYQRKKRNKKRSEEDKGRKRKLRHYLKIFGWDPRVLADAQTALPPESKNKKGKKTFNSRRKTLASLGAVRIQAAGFTVEEALGAIQELEVELSFDNMAPFKSNPEWSKAKKTAKQTLQTLFPGMIL